MAYRVTWNGMSAVYFDVVEADLAAAAYGGTVEEIPDPRRFGPGNVREASGARQQLFQGLGGPGLAADNRNRPRVEDGVSGQAGGKPKFTKNQAIYVQASRWPWITCGTCVYFQPAQKQCTIVGAEGSPDLGFISQDSLCNLWSARAFAPAAGRIRIAEAMVGRGADARGILRPGGARDRILERAKREIY